MMRVDTLPIDGGRIATKLMFYIFTIFMAGNFERFSKAAH